MEDGAAAGATAQHGNAVGAAEGEVCLDGGVVGVAENDEVARGFPEAQDWAGAARFAEVEQGFVAGEIGLGRASG